jgi:DNA-binding NtrC family response regulator
MLNQTEEYSMNEQSKELFISNLVTSYLKSNLYSDDEKLSLKDLITKLEKEIISKALKICNGNQRNAASLLKLNYTTLNEKLKRMNIRIVKQTIFENMLM